VQLTVAPDAAHTEVRWSSHTLRRAGEPCRSATRLERRELRGVKYAVMKILEVSLSEQTVTKLEAAARRLGLQPEDLVRVSVEDKLSQLDEDFQSAADYVMRKNAELYRRLA
jgi:hypothetical protein